MKISIYQFMGILAGMISLIILTMALIGFDRVKALFLAATPGLKAYDPTYIPPGEPDGSGSGSGSGSGGAGSGEPGSGEPGSGEPGSGEPGSGEPGSQEAGSGEAALYDVAVNSSSLFWPQY